MKQCLSGLTVAMLLGMGCLVVDAAIGADAKAKFEMSPGEKELLELTNKERAKEKLSALKPDPLLFKAARAHSANMAKQGKMEHNLDGKTPYQRIKATGYLYRFAGENIAAGDVPAADIMQAWMKSKPHRENILNPKYSQIGLGLVVDGTGATYYTQVFGHPLQP